MKRLIALDVSASMNGAPIDRALAKVNVGDHLITFTHQVENDLGVQTAKPTRDSVKFSGFGGTMVEPVLEFADKAYPNGCELVIISDGYYPRDALDAAAAKGRHTIETVEV